MVTVVASVLWVIYTETHYESMTHVRVGALTTTTAYSGGKKGHIRAIIGMGPHSRVGHTIAISPVPCCDLLLDTLPQEAYSSHSPLESSQLSEMSENRYL